MFATRRRRDRGVNVWPGFVDALTTLVMVVTFLLMVFVLAQFFLSQALSGRDEQIRQINRQLSDLADVLSMERRASADLRQTVAELSLQLQSATSARDDLTSRLAAALARADASEAALGQIRTELSEANRTIAADKDRIDVQLAIVAGLQAEIEALQKRRRDLEGEIAAERDVNRQAARALAEASRTVEADRETIRLQLVEIAELQRSIEALKQAREALEKEVGEERDLSRASRGEVARLSQQIEAFRAQISRLSELLDLAEKEGALKEARITDLGRQLNRALAAKVEELARYRSEFFGRLREVLGGRQDVRIVGDRFVFQSEVLFDTASAELGEPGQAELGKLAQTLKEIAARIPPGIDWILRVDGHTDRRPIRSTQFPSNWELSTARALSVVRYLSDAGIPPEHLAATGFGEFQPLDTRDDEIAYRRNRRIELKLTER